MSDQKPRAAQSVINGEVARELFFAKDNSWVHGYRRIACSKFQIIYIDPSDDKYWGFDYTEHYLLALENPSDFAIVCYRVEPFIVQHTEWRRLTD